LLLLEHGATCTVRPIYEALWLREAWSHAWAFGLVSWWARIPWSHAGGKANPGWWARPRGPVGAKAPYRPMGEGMAWVQAGAILW